MTVDAGTHIQRRVVLLGPQHEQQTVARAVEDLGVESPFAAITAGWAEREGEDAELSDHLGGRTINLGLYPRAEEVFAEDPTVRAMLFERYDRLRALQAVYRLRLAPQLQTCRELLARTDPANPDALHGPEIDGAIAGVRALDAHHLERTAGLDSEIAHRIDSHNRSSIERHRNDLAHELDDVGALLIAGGHVGRLLNRLRLFDIFGLTPGKPVVAWSGGAAGAAFGHRHEARIVDQDVKCLVPCSDVRSSRLCRTHGSEIKFDDLHGGTRVSIEYLVASHFGNHI